MSITTHRTTDVDDLTAAQRAAWAAGDDSMIAPHLSVVAERLCHDGGLRPGWQVVDVATGSGNAALAAARIGCTTVGVDLVPELLERARARAAAERLHIEVTPADARALPFESDSFDAATSVFGVMFAVDQQAAARELVRVVRPGGTIAMASWMPDGFVGELFETAERYAPPGPAPSPFAWGTQDGLVRLFGRSINYLQLRPRRFTFRFRSAEEFLGIFRRFYGPLVRAFEVAGDERALALELDLLRLIRRHDRQRGRGGIAVSAAYLEAIAITR
ncbi:MAG TPA: class I SAM-dependent methyltransferase [Gaiellales bacterium]|jgi:ubiquinone/menaquinone biosynthesis C-methylase UbiE